MLGQLNAFSTFGALDTGDTKKIYSIDGVSTQYTVILVVLNTCITFGKVDIGGTIKYPVFSGVGKHTWKCWSRSDLIELIGLRGNQISRLLILVCCGP